MKRNLLIAGGLFLIGGSLAYYYLSQQNGNGQPSCRTYDGDPQGCQQQQCYYWSDGTCRNYPEGQIPCDPDNISYTCHPGFTGMKRCDIFKNQCQCDGTNWNLLEPDSQICRDEIRHTECWVNAEDYATCLNTYETGNDLCELLNEIGCPCGGSVLCGGHTGASWCSPRLMECIAEAGNLNISADNSNWNNCFNTTTLPWCDWFSNGQTCDYSLDKEYAASNLSGAFSWEWSQYLASFKLRVYGYLEGYGWTQLGSEKEFTSYGTEGSSDFNLNFTKQGLSKLRFSICGAVLVNTKPKSFYGLLR